MNNKVTTLTRRNLLKSATIGAAASSMGLLLPAESEAQTTKLSGRKVLILYFSKTDTTGTLARQLNSIVGGHMAKLETVAPYPASYNATTEQAKKEQEANYRPPIKPLAIDINSYDVIFLGYPCWWGTLPMAYFTLLEQNNLAGKIIVPFSTHEGSYFGISISDLKRLCPDANVLEGYATSGKNSDKRASSELTAWLQKNSLA